MSIIDWPLNKWLGNVALGALSSKETLLATFDLARNCIERGIPGDFVECGVFGGAQVAVMARALMLAGATNRKVHLFDSFAGVPDGGSQDTEWTHPEGVSICPEDAVRTHLEEWGIDPGLLVWHAGLFSSTISIALAGPDLYQIAMLRLDADLYESTKDCLPLLDRVSPGGWVIVDDFSLSGCRKAIMERIIPAPIYFQVSR